MQERDLLLPADFADYAWEVKAKGVFWDALVQTGSEVIGVVFYDQVRLAQDISEELKDEASFELKRTLVVKEVTLSAMKDAILRAPEEFFQ